MRIWTLEQIDTETRNSEAWSTVVGVFPTREACLAYATARALEDAEGDADLASQLQDDEPETFSIGSPEDVFVYLGTAHDVEG